MLNSTTPFERIDSAGINSLPVCRYDGPVTVVREPAVLRSALSVLGAERVLGFDTETRPAFKKGVWHPPALLQLAGSTGVYIFQLARVGFPESLRSVLADPGRIKSGVALDHDVRMLQELEQFTPAGFVELEALAQKAGLKNFGLRGIAAAVLRVRISKKARLSNWAAEQLRPDQIAYAATDAWISRELYLRFEKAGYVPA